MAFVALRFDTDADAADEWSDTLLAAGALSVDLADPDADTPGEVALFDEPGASAARWRRSRLTALYQTAEAMDASLATLAAQGDLLPPHETFSVEDLDWVRATQAQFAPLRITEGLWIVPSWCEPVVPSAINLSLDPGLAFGTGSHPTTRLCLRWLVRELREGETVLDYGCGSGILAIAAGRLGASRVVGTDIDMAALTASRDNAARNQSSANFVTLERLSAVELFPFDVVIANILANPLVLLAPALAARVRIGGRVVLSGVLEAQAEIVIAAYRRWFTIGVFEDDDGWIALAGARNATIAGD